ncbi:MAG: GNAT family N-acetyltransferase [Chloroflexota bacterium]
MILRTALRSDKPYLASLIHFERFVHRHLDWRSILDWVDRSPFIILEENGKIEAALACPEDPPEVSWIRLFVVAAQKQPQDVWECLWEAAWETVKQTSSLGVVAAIPLAGWFQSLLIQSKFRQTNEVVVLSWTSSNSANDFDSSFTNIRPMTMDDLESVTMLDHLAFQIPWQVSYDGLMAGFLQSAVASVAMRDDEIIGYQISTATIRGGHLARLAVSPRYQNQGVGLALVRDIQKQFLQQGITTVTVNTQANNYASLRLYQKTGFSRTGESFPLFQYP